MPLDGIRVVDWTAYMQGPVASMMLGDLGAEVIKVEGIGIGDPGRGSRRINGVAVDMPDGRNSYIEINNRNKKSIAVDVTKPLGREVIYRLIEHSDVFVQNFRVGVAERLGLDYETLRERNPKLVYASASSFGPLGPDSQRPGGDPTGCARSGVYDALYFLESEEPYWPPFAMADQSGAVMLAYGVVTALLARERLGIGQKVESSLLSSMLWLQAANINTYLLMGRTFPRLRHNEVANPMFNSYRCKDGKWLFLALNQFGRFWPDFCRAIERPDLEHDQRFADVDRAAENHRALIAELDVVFAARTSNQWVEILRDYPDFIYQTVNSVGDLLEDAQVQANDYITDFAHPTLGNIKTVNVPIRLSETPGSIRLPAPESGQHTEEVLTEICGYSWADLVALGEAGAIH